MERCIKEENVTKSLISWLEENGWQIIAYDFPQSGTGIILHPNSDAKVSKTKDSFIPDIIAYKHDTAVFFENKNRFVAKDFDKVNRLRHTTTYSNAIKNLFGPPPQHIGYGIGIPYTAKNLLKALAQQDKVDFIILVNDTYGKADIVYDRLGLFK